ncbi:single-stranded DNA-binding protein [Actinopolyspora mortivallis]|uniref:single-stranded DNA-binding protein n=1 Tax=Actinopolyspora mortivallis TaxID=33906 RepID=UPI0003A80C36|nr:single-stranded DNA-binding protein [Actinopolyspora mortivallis]
MYETTVTLVGEVLSVPKSRQTRSGNQVVSFRMVSIARRFDRTSRRWVDGDRVYATVHCWKELAQGVLSSLDKKDPVVVTGKLRTREYEVEGQRRVTAEVEASAVGLDVLYDIRAGEDSTETSKETSKEDETSNEEEALPYHLRAVNIVGSGTDERTRHPVGA